MGASLFVIRVSLFVVFTQRHREKVLDARSVRLTLLPASALSSCLRLETLAATLASAFNWTLFHGQSFGQTTSRTTENVNVSSDGE